ncbi:hypothetical protein LAZ67_14002008 [Cordylochernes scorpioides]|uniref:Uncharacterized protein n=1 Tax=Cordylochernes scorpioides TaxID=51811 RepID=A0ABY6L6J2_9ARAC|nr:hypothetical protein LAZ67_14002008 [Cordylochernes scorpioides]
MWKRGFVSDVHFRPDGQVRVATITTKQNGKAVICKRPVTKIYPLGLRMELGERRGRFMKTSSINRGRNTTDEGSRTTGAADALSLLADRRRYERSDRLYNGVTLETTSLSHFLGPFILDPCIWRKEDEENMWASQEEKVCRASLHKEVLNDRFQRRGWQTERPAGAVKGEQSGIAVDLMGVCAPREHRSLGEKSSGDIEIYGK